jgi:tRNA nucleotidyltransferase/poly(A) polymerase
MKDFLTKYPELKIVNDRLKSRGYQFYLVGGCVRDFLLGEEPKDIDVVTDAVPDVVEEIFKDFRILTVGKSFGVIKILFKSGFDIEVATFRADIGKGRRPDSVVFTTAEEDVKRRDFTINGLLYDIDKDEIIDYVRGQQDLNDGILKTIGNPKDRFDEDPLRKLRTLRFAHRLDFIMSTEICDALLEDASLTGVSHERIVDEMTKSFLKAKDPMLLANDYAKLGLDHIIFGRRFDPTFENLSNSISLSLARLFFHCTPNDIHNMLKLCKFPSHVCERVEFLISLKHLTTEKIYLLKKRQKNLKIGNGFILKFTELLNLDSFNELKNRLIQFSKFELTIEAKNIIAMGFTGPDITHKMVEFETQKWEEHIA